jgi:hypothetical protein
VLSGHTGPVLDVVFSPDGKQIATSSSDGTARLWNASTGQALAVMRIGDSPVWGAIYSPDGKRLATRSADGRIGLWDGASGNRLRTFVGHEGPIHGFAFSPDSRLLASAGEDAVIQVWSADTGSHQLSIEGPQAPIWDLAFFPDGRRIVTGAGQWNINLIKQGWPADRTAVIWDLQTGKRVATLSLEYWVDRVSVSADGKKVLFFAGLEVGVWLPFRDARELIDYTCSTRPRALTKLELAKTFLDADRPPSHCSNSSGSLSAETSDDFLESAVEHTDRGDAYYAKGDYDRAIADYTQAVALDPNYFAAYFQRARSYERAGDFDRAIADYAEAIRLSPLDVSPVINRGIIYKRKGEYDLAIADYNKVGKLCNEGHCSRYGMKITYDYRGDAYRAKGDLLISSPHRDMAPGRSLSPD